MVDSTLMSVVSISRICKRAKSWAFRSLSLALSLVLCVCMIPIPAFAEEDASIEERALFVNTADAMRGSDEREPHVDVGLLSDRETQAVNAISIDGFIGPDEPFIQEE